MLSRRLLFLLVSLGLALILYVVGGGGIAHGQATATITGEVVDAETNAPLPGVNVYLCFLHARCGYRYAGAL